MRQLWPGARELGPAPPARSLFHLGAFLLWAFLTLVGAASVKAASAVSPRSLDRERPEFHFPEDAAAPSHNPKALATILPRDGDLVVRSDRARSSGGSVVPFSLGPRSLKDFEVEDFVLLVTVDGALSARERRTGEKRWELTAVEPVVSTVYHRANVSRDETVDTDYTTWIVGPAENGELWQYTEDGGLEKLDVTIKDIVEFSPYAPPGFDVVYNGEKRTTTYLIDAQTGDVRGHFSSGRTAGKINRKKCPHSTGLQQLECDVQETSGPDIMIARTEYTITIQSRSTAETLWTIKYNQWGPNNSDRDLLMQYERSLDDRYILSGHDGKIYGFESFDDPAGFSEGRPSWHAELSSPVVVAFDVVRSRDPDADLLILNQPLVQPKGAGSANGFAAWVGCTSQGGLFAMSEMRFPSVTSGSEQALCYKEKFEDWPFLDTPKRQKLLVGKHHVRYAGARQSYRPSIAGPSGGYGNDVREHYTGNTSPPASQPNTPDQLSTLSGLAKKIAQNGVFISAFALVSFLGVFVTVNHLSPFSPNQFFGGHSLESKVAVDSRTLHGQSPPNTVQVDVQPAPSPDIGDVVVEPKVEPPKKSTVTFAEDTKPEVRGEGKAEGEEPNEATPKKKKAHRGKRGGAARKKNRDNGEKSSDEKEREAPNVALPDTNLKMVANGEVQDVVQGQHETLNNLTIYMDKVLGTGGQGTIVYEGLWEDKPVAVKQIPTIFMDVAEHEVRLLQKTDYHPNVVRYYCRQQKFNHIYIALEKCPGSLYDLFVKAENEEFKKLRQEMDKDIRDALLQVTKGLDHLHSVKIVHRDIKPQNILVGAPNFPNPKDPTSFRPRMLISDFGLCKKLQTDEYSFGVTTAHNAGTVGWRAPELLREWDPKTQPKPQDKESSGTGSGTEVIVDAHTKRRATKAIDIFALGCVFYFVLSNGLHPFGERIEREYNIIQGNYNLAALDSFQDEGAIEARDLISGMIQRDPKQRPDTRTTAMHPFFWPRSKSLEFLTDVSDRFEVEKDKEKNDPGYSSPYIPLLEADAPSILKGDWIKRVEQHFHNELFATKRRGYEGTRVLDLLRAIRNKKNHYQDMAPEAQAAVGPLPDGYLSYFTTRFPELLMHTHRVVRQAGFDEEPRFQRYFTVSNW